jgi:DNA-binding CsgD family transcriptional regulator
LFRHVAVLSNLLYTSSPSCHTRPRDTRESLMDEARLLRLGLQASHAIVNNEPFAADLADGLRRVVGADCVCIDVCHNWRTQRPSVTLAGEPSTLSATEIDRWMRLYADDPYVVNLLATGDPRPYRASDFMAFNRFQQTPVYREVFAGLEMRHLLVMTPSITEQDLVMIGLTRRLHDFSDRETSALHPLRDLIAAALDYKIQINAIQASIHAEALPVQPRRLTLTERENQVLALIATGHTNDQAARKLGISPRTIRKHLEGVFTKAKVPSRTAAVAWWLRQSRP